MIKKSMAALLVVLALAVGLFPGIAFAEGEVTDTSIIPKDVYYGPSSTITASHTVDTWTSSGNKVRFCVYYDDGSGTESLISQQEYESGTDYNEVKKYTFKAVGLGTYRVTFGHMKYDNTWYCWKYSGTVWQDTCVVKQARKANTMTVAINKVTFSASKLKSKACSVKAKKAFTVKKAKGAVTYKVVKSVTKNAQKKVKVSKNGKVTVKKGTPKGTYKLKVKVTAAGNDNYEPKSKTVKLVVKVK